MSALNNGDIVTKLAEGLQQFIGYKSGSNPHGHITGAGIAPSNMATHRLCDAAIAFTIGVLEGCKNGNNKNINLKEHHKRKIDEVLIKLNESYGKGSANLKVTLQSELASLKGTNVWSFVDDIGKAFETNLKSLNGQSDFAETVAQKVGEYIKAVFKGSGNGKNWKGDASMAATQLQLLAKKFQSKPYDPFQPIVGGYLEEMGQLEKGFVTDSVTPSYLKPILEAGKEEFVWHLEKGYVSYYQGTKVDTSKWDSDNIGEAKSCAQIFLGCIPLIYHCLTQFYWLCNETSRGWDKYPFSGGGLRNLMVALGYGDAFLGGSTGKTVMTNVALKLSELSSAGNATPKSYPEFLTKLNGNFESVFKSSNLTDQTIPALYHIARLYFRHRHGRNTEKPRPPSSIREMLYWLSGLQFSPQYDSLQDHISSVFRNLLGQPTTTPDTQLSLPVADSGATNTSNNTLSAFDLKGYLTMTCLYSPMVLGRLQGPGVSNGIEDPYLHHLFGNGMSFAYPSDAVLLSKLSEYAYALQFQLSFLTQQCFTHNGDGCGWRKCRFGSTVHPTKDTEAIVPSHLCHADCQNHSSGDCQHKGPSSTNCGTGNQGSPLQAFLTDNLQGFRRGHHGTSDHLASCSSNSMCHVPMGFKAECLRETPGYGYHVFYPLLFYCSDNSRPLRLLSDKLHCISNYTPRSLGDMLGFYLHLTRQVFNKRSEDLSSYITGLLNNRQPQSRAGLVIFEYLENSIVELGSALHGVVRHCHNKKASDSAGQIKHQNVSGGPCSHSNSPADLWSLFALDNPSKYPNCAGGQKCGAYLSPLTRSYGSTFGKSAGFASTYLSWVSYLADDFKERLESLLIDFRNISCTDCKTQNGKNCNCTKGQHGTSSCQCYSVVSCSGVLPPFYEHGFNFLNVQSLSGKVVVGVSDGDDEAYEADDGDHREADENCAAFGIGSARFTAFAFISAAISTAVFTLLITTAATAAVFCYTFAAANPLTHPEQHRAKHSLQPRRDPMQNIDKSNGPYVILLKGH
ncbi:variant erythrocyte surface antigen-1 family protein [Babesia caballi]|uniref:Variant erythrocyte surface antigen-1 family protein n=1 Tax=Babesia caballi TaxID=5871 RepID=A0AAV4LUC1_BABCB|nr:variant erythrocyte surface antigen-1 family protein [Babesia caballi]